VHFDWDEKQKNVVLGSFFWGYLMTEIPGGRMAEVFGPRRVLGYSMLLSSLLTLVTPLVASWGYLPLAAIRAFIGFLLVSRLNDNAITTTLKCLSHALFRRAEPKSHGP